MAAAKTNKPRIHSVAKELGVDNKELMEVLKKYGMGEKNHMSALTPADMDIIFDYYTHKFDDGSDIGEFLKKAEKEKKEEVKEPKKAKEEPVEEEPRDTEIKAPKSRYVDTRSDVVDLEKMAKTEEIEEKLTDEMQKNGVGGKQKIKKKNKNKQKQTNNKETAAPKPKKKEKVKVVIPHEVTVGEFAERTYRKGRGYSFCRGRRQRGRPCGKIPDCCCYGSR